MDEKMTIDERIELTDFQAGDKSNLLLYLNDSELYRNTLSIPNPYMEADADNWLALTKDLKEKQGMMVNWAIRHSEAGLIGGIGCFLKTGADGHRDEIGYWLAEPFRGQGIMSRVIAQYTDYLFASRPLERLEAWVYVHNPASVKALENAGFQREGFARKYVKKDGVCIDAILLAKIRE